MKELTAASVVILIGLAGAYFYLYRLYLRRLFLYLSIAWLTNLAYIFVEMHYKSEIEILSLYSIALVSLVSAVGTIFFFLAIADWYELTRRAIWTYGGALLCVIAIALTAGTVGDILGLSRVVSATLMTAGIAAASFFTAFALGASFTRVTPEGLLGLLRKDTRSRGFTRSGDADEVVDLPRANPNLTGENKGLSIPTEVRPKLQLAAGLVAASFYIYALLQPFYPLRWSMADRYPEFFGNLFWVGLIAKVLQGFALPWLVMADLRSVVGALRERSAAEELGVLTASIEHDIKTPLALIEKQIELLKDQYQHLSPLKAKLNDVLENAGRIGAAASIIPATREMIEHFKEYAENINVVAVLRSAANNVKRVKGHGDLRIDVASSRPEIIVFGDKARLTQAFVNLINNGVEACRAADARRMPVIEVSCTVERTGRCRIHIDDRGVGIPPAALSKVGRPFFSTKSGQGKNRGIGVFMASRVIRLHSGDMRFESDGLTSTTVIITLPLAPHKTMEVDP